MTPDVEPPLRPLQVKDGLVSLAQADDGVVVKKVRQAACTLTAMHTSISAMHLCLALCLL